jgi:hypothetical protein
MLFTALSQLLGLRRCMKQQQEQSRRLSHGVPGIHMLFTALSHFVEKGHAEK